MADRPPPSTAAIVIATTIIAGLGGYFMGQASALGVFSSASSKGRAPRSSSSGRVDKDGDDSGEDHESELSDEEQEGLKVFEDEGGECKLVLVVRTDLGMGKGKIAAQASHATLACYKSLANSTSPILTRWLRAGQPKITLQVKSEDELLLLQAQAESLGLCARVVRDAGRTQIAAGEATVLGVGPGPRGVVDGVTGGLRLL